MPTSKYYRQQFLKAHPEVILAECRLCSQCCREVRLDMPTEAGKLCSGYNTLTEEFEYWLCIQASKDYNRSQLQRVLNYQKEKTS